MPTHDTGDAVTRRDAPSAGAWSDPVAAVSAAEHFATRDDGTIRRGVLVSWRTSAAATPVRGFRVLLREVGAETWAQAGEAGPDSTSLLILDRFRVGARYEVAVDAIGPTCCARRPVGRIAAAARVRILGDAAPPPAPQGLRLVRLADRVVLRWDPVAVAGVPVYEVRYGPSRWPLAEVLGQTTHTELAVEVAPTGLVGGAPAVSFHVAAIDPTGAPGNPAHLEAAPDWGVAADVGPDETSAPGWSSTKVGTVVQGTALELDAASTSGTYVAALDAGASVEWRVYVVTLARRTNEVLTPRLMQFAPSSWWGRRWTPNGGNIDAYPQNPVPRISGLSPAAWPSSPSSSGGLKPSSFSRPRPDDSPIVTPNEARFAPSSRAGRSMTPARGVGSTAGTGVAVEVRFSPDGSTWSAWAPYVRGQVREFRHVQARLTITQPLPAMRVTVDDFAVYVVRARPAALETAAAMGLWAEDETPAGTINGTNDTFTLAHTPIAGAVPMLFRNGVLQRRGVGADFTISGSTITYAAGSKPAPGDWHRVWYRY